MSSSTDDSSSSSSESSSGEIKQISRASSRPERSSKTRLQRKSHSRSRSRGTFKCSSKKATERSIEVFQAIFLLKIAAIKVTSKREEKKKITQRPEGLLRASSFKIRFTGSSRGRLRETDPNATTCSSKTRDQTSAAQTYSDPRSAPTSSTNVEKG